MARCCVRWRSEHHCKNAAASVLTHLFLHAHFAEIVNKIKASPRAVAKVVGKVAHGVRGFLLRVFSALTLVSVVAFTDSFSILSKIG